MTELLYIPIFNRYARKDTKERTRLNLIKSPISPLLEVSPLLTRKNSAKLKTQFPLLKILLTWASEQVPPCPSQWFLFCSSRPRSQSTLLKIPQYPFHHLLWPWQEIASTIGAVCGKLNRTCVKLSRKSYYSPTRPNITTNRTHKRK